MSSAAHREKLLQVLVGPHVSEKATSLADGSSQVVFKVRPDATKSDIRQAVEMLFEVKVARVTTLRMPTKLAKARRFGSSQGKRSGWKKAYVRLAPGSDINFMGAE